MNFRSSVRLGEWDIDSEHDCVFREEGYEECSDAPLDFEPEEIIPHPGFSVDHLQNDIALIRLKTAAPWTDTIRPVCLPTTHMDISGENFTVAGWGATENGKHKKNCTTIFTKFFLSFQTEKATSNCSSQIFHCTIK